MNTVLRISLMVLKYLVNIGPLVYEAAHWGIKIAKEVRAKKSVSPVEGIVPEQPGTNTKPDLDPG